MFSPDDDDDFVPSSRLNLFSIFNSNSSSESKTSLSYKAPKQPKLPNENNDEPMTKPEGTSSVILAKIINLWKSEQGTNKLMGKHMIAILGNSSKALYEAIIYKDKTKILIRNILNEHSNFYKYPKNFIGFYDIQNNFWNINFNNANDYEGFLAEMAKYNCNIISKDLDNNNSEQDSSRIAAPESPPQNDTFFRDPAINKKSDILTRISKVGLSIMPELKIKQSKAPSIEVQSDSDRSSPSSTSIPSDSETDSARKIRNKKRILSNSTYNNIHSMVSPVVSSTNSILAQNNQMVVHSQDMLSQPLQTYTMNNLLIAQNADLKANLTDISMKLNTLMNIQTQKESNNEPPSEMHSKVKCLNLKVANLSLDLEKVNKKCIKLQKNYELKCKELLEQEKSNDTQNMSVEIESLKNKLSENKEELKSLKSDITEKNTIIEDQKSKIDDFVNCDEENKHLIKEVEELKRELKETKTQIVSYEQKLQERQIETDNSKNVSSNNIDHSKIIKSGMNDAFTEIMGHFDDNIAYSSKDIQVIVLKSLKQATFNIIKELNDSS